MTLEELEACPKAVVTAADIADILGASPNTIRFQAQECPEKLGFPVIVMGSRVKIPRKAFLAFMNGYEVPEQ